MMSNLRRRSRARPRVNYICHPAETARRCWRYVRKTAVVDHGVLLVRCGGGYRVLRRGRLPA
jgi:hypothetical protein